VDREKNVNNNFATLILLIACLFLALRFFWKLLPRMLREGIVHAVCQRIIVGSPGGGISLFRLFLFLLFLAGGLLLLLLSLLVFFGVRM
jgi:hypothetical protein